MAQAESFQAGLTPDLSPICNFVDTKILLFVANDKVLTVKWVKVLVVTTRRNLLLPNEFRFPELLTADISDIATYPVPFVLRDDKSERTVGIRFDLDTSLWFVEAKDKENKNGLTNDALKSNNSWMYRKMNFNN